MDNESHKDSFIQAGIKIHEYRHGAWSGEFPTIIVATLSALAGGVLSSIGGDIWKALKVYLKKRFELFERDRQSKKGTRKGRSHVLSVFIVAELDGVPLVYYSIPTSNEIHLDFDHDELLRVEAEIRALIRSDKINKNKFLGINLSKLGSGPCLSIFKEIPSQKTMDGPGEFAPREEKTMEEIITFL
jgi:hypothetical protein